MRNPFERRIALDYLKEHPDTKGIIVIKTQETKAAIEGVFASPLALTKHIRETQGTIHDLTCFQIEGTSALRKFPQPPILGTRDLLIDYVKQEKITAAYILVKKGNYNFPNALIGLFENPRQAADYIRESRLDHEEYVVFHQTGGHRIQQFHLYLE